LQILESCDIFTEKRAADTLKKNHNLVHGRASAQCPPVPLPRFVYLPRPLKNARYSVFAVFSFVRPGTARVGAGWISASCFILSLL
jgi:hypothetical protein